MLMPALTPALSMALELDAWVCVGIATLAAKEVLLLVTVVIEFELVFEVIDKEGLDLVIVDVAVCSRPLIPMIVWTTPGLTSKVPLPLVQSHEGSLAQQNLLSPQASRLPLTFVSSFQKSTRQVHHTIAHTKTYQAVISTDRIIPHGICTRSTDRCSDRMRRVCY